jgi:hypothetical protein
MLHQFLLCSAKLNENMMMHEELGLGRKQSLPLSRYKMAPTTVF